MALAKKGDKVKINFTGKLEDGTIIDSTYEDMDCGSDEHGSEGCGCGSDHGSDDCGCDSDECGCETGPMELTIGEEEFFTMIEEGLIGMAPGEKKTVVIPAAEAFGEYDTESVFSIGRDQVPAGITPEVGQELEFTDEDGEELEVTVVEVSDELITLDANHPLAGEDLTFEFELVEIL